MQMSVSEFRGPESKSLAPPYWTSWNQTQGVGRPGVVPEVLEESPLRSSFRLLAKFRLRPSRSWLSARSPQLPGCLRSCSRRPVFTLAAPRAAPAAGPRLPQVKHGLCLKSSGDCTGSPWIIQAALYFKVTVIILVQLWLHLHYICRFSVCRVN